MLFRKEAHDRQVVAEYSNAPWGGLNGTGDLLHQVIALVDRREDVQLYACFQNSGLVLGIQCLENVFRRRTALRRESSHERWLRVVNLRLQHYSCTSAIFVVRRQSYLPPGVAPAILALPQFGAIPRNETRISSLVLSSSGHRYGRSCLRPLGPAAPRIPHKRR